MKRSRMLLLSASAAVALLLVGGVLGLRVGAADSSYRQVILFSEVLSLVLENYVDPLEADSLLQGAYEGMLSGLDSQGAYLSPDEVKAWKGDGASGLADPGITALKVYGALQVVAVEPESPAEVAGIVPGDQIRLIDGVPLRDLSLAQATRRLRGEAGTTVTLSLLYPQRNFEREEVVLERVERLGRPYELGVEQGIAVLTVRDLARVEPQELVGELEDVWSRGVEKLLFDLRDVVEQDPRSATDLLRLFVSGPLFTLRDRNGRLLDSIEVGGTPDAWSGRIAVLVNRATAGASEGMASLLQKQRGATVFGEATFGLGAEPKLFELPDGSGVLVAAALWETAGGDGWNGQGVEPDQVIRIEGRDFDEVHAEQLARALEAFDREPVESAEREKAA